MGRNYYLQNDIHIGKQSAAGYYCWDCNITLCKLGNSKIHCSDPHTDWHDECPRCGNKKQCEPIDQSAAGQMLGFTKDYKERHTGVKSVCSFTWAINPNEFFEMCNTVIKDEYKKKYTYKQFKNMLEYNCPIEFYNSIGVDFS